MKFFGIVLSLGGIYLAAQLGSNAMAFLDLPAILFVIFVGFGILIASHGLNSVGSFVVASFKSDGADNRVRQVAETGITAFVAAGWIGSLIGVVQLLSALEDPAQIGTATAVALLTAFYGYVIAYAICFPITRTIANVNLEQA